MKRDPANRPSRRLLSAAEEAFFHDALKDAKRLPKRQRAPGPPTPSVGSVFRLALPAGPPANLPVHAGPPAPTLGGHREAHARRGRIEPEARLDLHGHTQDAAHRALARFIGRAHGLDHRVVLVITGKGGVLHQMLPRWLGERAFGDLVAGVAPAHIRHGGSGAYYVALRRDKTR